MFFSISSKGVLYAPSHRQDSIYHGVCYTSCGDLAGTRNSWMGLPWENRGTESLSLLHSIYFTVCFTNSSGSSSPWTPSCTLFYIYYIPSGSGLNEIHIYSVLYSRGLMTQCKPSYSSLILIMDRINTEKLGYHKFWVWTSSVSFYWSRHFCRIINNWVDTLSRHHSVCVNRMSNTKNTYLARWGSCHRRPCALNRNNTSS